MADPAVVAEVLTERWWRYRCGEPMPNAFPTRCRRDLSHPSPHAGAPAADGRFPTWAGVGNASSAQTGPGYRCWHTLREEGVHTATWRDPLWPDDVAWLDPVVDAQASGPQVSDTGADPDPEG